MLYRSREKIPIFLLVASKLWKRAAVMILDFIAPRFGVDCF
jgi:hypothetical protein